MATETAPLAVLCSPIFGRNITLEAAFNNYTADIREHEPGNEEMCRDYWIFLYLSSGLNITDFCRLKWKYIESDRILFIREKTTRTKKLKESIHIIIQEEAQSIIDKWGSSKKSKDDFIFSSLT